MSYTKQQMLDLIQSSRARLDASQTRELHLANPRELHLANSDKNTTYSQNFDENHKCPREVYKDIKIKREKYISRSSEELDSLPSAPLGEDHLEEDNNVPPARTTSRITGITVQHVKTKKGVKLNVAVQTEQDAVNGEYVELTAELKRHSRLRELKRYEPDDIDFQELYLATIEELKQLNTEQGRAVAMGRLHVRGARGHWFANMMMVAQFDENDIVRTALLHINGEEFEISLNGILSPNQLNLYHSTGIYGRLSSTKPAPRLETAVRKAYNP